METKIKRNYSDYFEFFLYALAIVCFAYYLYFGNIHKMLQPVLIASVLVSIRCFINYTKIDAAPALKLALLIFIFVAMFLAVEFDFYSIIPGLDKIEHLSSGVIFVFVGLTLFRYINRTEANVQVSSITIIFFCLFFSIAIAGCWEIFEFSMDKFFGMYCQRGSLVDTMEDIICGTTGATIASIYLSYKIGIHNKDVIINNTSEVHITEANNVINVTEK